MLVGVLAAALLLLNLASLEAFPAIGTTCIVVLYLPCAMLTGGCRWFTTTLRLLRVYGIVAAGRGAQNGQA